MLYVSNGPKREAGRAGVGSLRITVRVRSFRVWVFIKIRVRIRISVQVRFRVSVKIRFWVI